jgi:hypothetical protein
VVWATEEKNNNTINNDPQTVLENRQEEFLGRPTRTWETLSTERPGS